MFGDEIKTLLDKRLAATPDTLEGLLEVMPYLRLRNSESIKGSDPKNAGPKR